MRHTNTESSTGFEAATRILEKGLQKMKRRIIISLMSLFMLSGSPSLADDKTWTGSVDNDFLTDGNWSGGVPASDEDIAIIEGGNNLPVVMSDSIGERQLGALKLGEFEAAGSLVQNGGTLNIVADTLGEETFIGLDAEGTSSLTLNGDSVLLYDEPFAEGDGFDTDGTGKDFDVGKNVPEDSLGLLELHNNAILRISDDLKLADGTGGHARLAMDGNSQVTVGSGISVDGTTQIQLSENALLVTGNSAGPGNDQTGRTNEGYLTLSTAIDGESTVEISDQARLYARTLQQRDGVSSITVTGEGQFHVFEVFESAEPSAGEATVSGPAQGPQRTSNVAQAATAEMSITLRDSATMTFDTDLDDSEWSGLALSGGTNRGGNADGGSTVIDVSDSAQFSVAQDLHMTIGIGPDANSTLKVTGPDAKVQIGGDLRMAIDPTDVENEGTATLLTVITAESQATVEVGGTALISNGDLVVELSGYTPTGGESYDLLVAETISGDAFRDTTLPPLAAPLAWNLMIDGTSVKLSILQPGDFNQNGLLDVEDINLLSAAVRSGDMDSVWDLNADGQVNNDDRVVWVNDLKNTYFGDANLDGEFNSGDLVAVFGVGEYEDGIPLNSGWGTGDWDGNGDFESGDLVVAFAEGAYETGPRPMNAVPEPAGLVLIGIAILMIGARRR